jgi:hypothetical protein
VRDGKYDSKDSTVFYIVCRLSTGVKGEEMAKIFGEGYISVNPQEGNDFGS